MKFFAREREDIFPQSSKDFSSAKEKTLPRTHKQKHRRKSLPEKSKMG
jgi:hypothetical protein